MCGGTVQGTFARKYKTCKACPFYVRVKREEYPAFKLSQALLDKLQAKP
jgi:hypothetical protein